MCSESVPKEFEKTVEVLPLSTYGLATVEDFRRAEADKQHLEWLKKAGLSNEELKLYQENEAGLLEQRKKIEASVLKGKLETLYNKINNHQSTPGCSKARIEPASTKPKKMDNPSQKQLNFYPEGHPMNELKELEESLFGHLKEDTFSLSQRRKIMRRLERKKERILAQEHQINFEDNAMIAAVNKPGSLWDVKEVTARPKVAEQIAPVEQKCLIGPRVPTMYTIRDNKIMRLEPINRERHINDEYRAVDIVLPVNPAEEQLLEGTKMPLDDIKKIDRFKDYEPGIPSKVLYLKNIAPGVSQEQLSLLFNQFVLDNGGPIDVRLMAGHMRGQAFVAFQSEDVAIQALDEVNGTILSGRPVIVQFGRNSNRVQPEDNN
ncbi:RNA-binding protein 41-like [Ostrinia furnacalis]|uniref:RNA-binding protein 41-like n=1 Tax=Ostrinia furnacalis TaxID=93504 RepID=UPI00103974CD|nr:RNA-binding protein 41-like [Ostrinia furnacalis]